MCQRYNSGYVITDHKNMTCFTLFKEIKILNKISRNKTRIEIRKI